MKAHYLCCGLAWCLSLPVLVSAAELEQRDPAEIVVEDTARSDGTGEEEGGQAGPATDDTDSERLFRLSSASFFQPPIEPAVPPTRTSAVPAPSATSQFVESVFAAPDVRRSLLSDYRRSLATGVGTELVFGSEGKFRATTDGGNLLGKSLFAPAVKAQQRTPIITDPRVRASRVGRLLASGSYWVPARDDLDTMLSKIDSRVIRDVIVVKGPYSVRYGPGFNFIDFELLGSPRSPYGFQSDGSTSIEFNTNGEQWYGRQSVWGAGSNWGYRVGYGHRTGSDYRTGGGFRLPTSYKSRDWDFAIGYDLTPRNVSTGLRQLLVEISVAWQL